MQLSGHCHCGAVSYKVVGEPARMAQCHCNACRRTTGSGHLVQAFFKKDDVAISGKPTSQHPTAAISAPAIFAPPAGQDYSLKTPRRQEPSALPLAVLTTVHGSSRR